MDNLKELKINTGIKTMMLPLMLVLFISTLDQTIVVTAINRIGEALGNMDLASWVTTAYLLTSAVTTLLFGKLGDMYGRKLILQISIAVFVMGSALCPLAQNMPWLIIFRAFQGIGGGGLNSLVMAIVGDLVAPRERGRYQAVLGIVPAIALLTGPLLGGLIVDQLSWPWIFLINIPIGAVAFVMIAIRLKLPVSRSLHRVDIAGAIFAIVFTTCFLLVTVLGGQKYAWDSGFITALMFISIGSLTAYIAVQHRAAEPITPLRLFSDRVFSISAALFFFSTGILFIGMLFVPLMLQTAFGLSTFVSGACIVPLLFGLIAATMVTGSRIAKTGRYKSFPIIGACLCAFSIAALSFIPSGASLWLIISVLMVLGAGIGLFIQVTVLAGQNAVAPRDLGTATGALNFFKNLGGASGAAVFGAILSSLLVAHPAAQGAAMLACFHTLFRCALPVTAITLLLALALPERPLSETAMEIAEGKIEVPEY